MRLSDEISKRLQVWISTHPNDIIIPNFYFTSYEMDVFKLIGSSSYVIEYEIKISRSDFFNDFNKGNKHLQIECAYYPCNRFYFVVPEGLILINEIPKYAGLIYYRNGFEIVKPASFIHKRKPSSEIYLKIAHNLSHRINHLKFKYLSLKDQNNFLLKEIKNEFA